MIDDIRVKVTKYADRRFWIMYYIDPITEKPVTRSTKKTNRREAEREAAKWEADLRAGRYHAETRITWNDFRQRYEAEKLASLAENTQTAAASAMNHLERILDPKRLASLTSAAMSRFQADLRAEGMIDTTIAAHLGHLRAALSWGVSMGMIHTVPEMSRPKRAKGRVLMRGRPITAEEFERMAEKVGKVRPRDAKIWQRYLTGLWLSGLRLEESLAVSWNPDAAFRVDLSGKHPRFRIYAEAEKGHRDRLLPMTPDFAVFLLETPEADRQGPVFKLTGRWTGKPITPKRVSRIISAIGREAGVIVNRTPKAVKYASAHDLRRAFGTRWARRVKSATLQRLMRHRSIETTHKYYVDLDADEMAEELWQLSESINTSINTRPTSAPHSDMGATRENSQPSTDQ